MNKSSYEHNILSFSSLIQSFPLHFMASFFLSASTDSFSLPNILDSFVGGGEEEGREREVHKDEYE